MKVYFEKSKLDKKSALEADKMLVKSVLALVVVLIVTLMQ